MIGHSHGFCTSSVLCALHYGQSSFRIGIGTVDGPQHAERVIFLSKPCLCAIERVAEVLPLTISFLLLYVRWIGNWHRVH